MTKEIPLTQGRVALVDDEDFDRLSKHKWHYHKTGYARRGEGGRKNHRKIYMHREVMNAPDDMEVDHGKGGTLDNRKSNLRVCTHKENSRNRVTHKLNSSVYKGVSWNKRDKRWHAPPVKTRHMRHM